MIHASHRANALGEIARTAGKIAQTARENMVSELKPDGSIVTNADRAVETWLRDELPRFQPGAGFWGEEFGFEDPGPEGLWVVDPVDGTSNFSFGSPLWGVSIALVKGNEITLGAVYLPDLDELYIGELGRGSFVNGRPIPPIPPGNIDDHQLVSYGDNILHKFANLKVPGKMRLTGAFVVDGSFVAVQRLRGMVGYRERLYDVAACVLVATEAGAEVRYVDGTPFDVAILSRPVPIQAPWVIFPAGSGFGG
jgi:myo-inositol-1(or 4)-monophosphatase